MQLYKQISTKENPPKAGWYNTDQGKLFWYESETVWSCRDDRVSEEYPNVWYQEVWSQGTVSVRIEQLIGFLQKEGHLKDVPKGNLMGIIDRFEKSLKFPQLIEVTWTEVKAKKPITWQTGQWDGNRSDLCICQDEKGEYHLAHLYEYHDGQFEWYDKDDYGLQHEVVKWAYVSTT